MVVVIGVDDDNKLREFKLQQGLHFTSHVLTH